MIATILIVVIDFFAISNLAHKFNEISINENTEIIQKDGKIIITDNPIEQLFMSDEKITEILCNDIMNKIKTKDYDNIKSIFSNDMINNVKNLKKVYEVKTDNKNYYIQLVIVPLNSRIQINNNITWELKTGGKDGIGDAPSKVTRLTEIEKFMLTSFDGKKVVVFLPNVKKIVKYINECEIVLVNELTDVYGAKVVSADNFKVYN